MLHTPLALVTLPLIEGGITVRPMVEADLPAVIAYRSDPAVARYQDWDMPYDAERAHPSPPGPLTAGWHGNLAIDLDSQFAGDLYVGIDAAGRTAEVGYTLGPRWTGRGIASRALTLMVDALFAAGLHRITASTDPENRDSMRVLERVGFRHEARLVRVVEIRGQWVDDEVFALLADERKEWIARPVQPADHLELREIADDTTAAAVGRLRTHPSQNWFVAPMHQTFRDMIYPEAVPLDYPAKTGPVAPVVPWSRAVVADGEIVGFVLVAGARPVGPHDEPYLWRLLVDRMHQRRGIGAGALRLVLEEWAALGHRTMLTSWVPGLRGSPEPFYLRLGFVPTGDIDDGEVVARYTAP